MTVDSTLAAIDGALEDWGTSGDAMRWQPDRVICDEGRPLWPERWSPWKHGIYRYSVTAMGGGAPVPITGAVFRDRMDAVAQALSVPLPDGMRFEWMTVDATSVQAAGELLVAATQHAQEAIVRAYGPAFQALFQAWGKGVTDIAHVVQMAYYPGPHRRCPRCHPAGNPGPLAISGADYRRRQRARRKRGR